MSAQSLPATTRKTDYFSLVGGLNLIKPALQIPPGMLIDCLNYEPEIAGGYRRINGYERFDGRPSPSLQAYWLLEMNITGVFAVGNAVTGVTSGATGIVVFVNAAELVLTKVTGVFVSAENIQVAAVTQGISTSASSQTSASTPALDAQYQAAAADNYRADIQKVPGSGPVRGTWVYNDIRYAFRDNVGATACVMYKATAGGWVAVALLNEVAFTAGGAAIPAEGTILTQGGVTATIKRVVTQSGTWPASSAAGRLIISNIAGGNFAAGAATIGALGLTLSGAQTAIALLPGGRYEFQNYNFAGSTVTYRMYGCDGVNRGFEFDSAGDVFVPIATGMVVDTPKFLACHKKQLFYAFKGSEQNSGIGTPYTWTVITGAAEIGLGDDITGFVPAIGNNTGGAMAVFARKETDVLYGSSVADFKMVNTVPDVGAVPYTAKSILGDVIYFDDRGIATLQQVQYYGNFEVATRTQLIQSFIDAKRGLAVSSSIVRGRNQYRLYFTDNSFVVIGFAGNKILGITRGDYGRVVRCICSEKLADGSEVVLFGSDDGYVYQAERGSSFDGANLEAWLRLPNNHSKSPRLRKRYRKASFEFASEGYSSISISQDLGYSDPDVPDAIASPQLLTPGGGLWDTVNWDQFFFDSRQIAPLEIDLTGTAVNIGFLIYSIGTFNAPHVLQSVTLAYSPRRIVR